ncbi:hypothetical protein L6R49_20235 [Myxococcota bacterium]|nr:hypothetical protein [Myxococcota bacterium]
MTNSGSKGPSGGTSSGNGGRTPDDHSKGDGRKHDGDKGGHSVQHDAPDGTKGAGARPRTTDDPAEGGRGINPSSGRKE